MSLRKKRQTRGNRKRARLRRQAAAAPGEGKTLKGEAWTCQRDAISPQGDVGSKPSRGCENPRTEGGDGVEPIVASGPAARMARRGKEPCGRNCFVGNDGRWAVFVIL
jgi:hypothetical protein